VAAAILAAALLLSNGRCGDLSRDELNRVVRRAEETVT